MREFFKNKKNIVFAGAILALLILMVVATVLLWPWFRGLSTLEGQEKLENFVESLGFGGWLVMFGLQILQIVVAFIPGEAVQIILGVLYGTWGGFFTCMLGALIGQAIVFALVRKFGYPLVRTFVGEEQIKSYKFLQNAARLEMITFLLFFIPGVPKDVLTYIAGLSPLKMSRFLLIATVARMPAVFTSTLGGASLASGNLWKTAVIFVAVGAVAIAGILLHKRLVAHFNKRGPSADGPKN